MDIESPKNWPSAETVEQVKRERETEERVRAMDASEIVDWVHSLEDGEEKLIEELSKTKSEVTDAWEVARQLYEALEMMHSDSRFGGINANTLKRSRDALNIYRSHPYNAGVPDGQ